MWRHKCVCVCVCVIHTYTRIYIEKYMHTHTRKHKPRHTNKTTTYLGRRIPNGGLENRDEVVEEWIYTKIHTHTYMHTKIHTYTHKPRHTSGEGSRMVVLRIGTRSLRYGATSLGSATRLHMLPTIVEAFFFRSVERCLRPRCMDTYTWM
jgi:hypothetical protein